MNTNWREIRRLHDELSDPFVMMPMKSASSFLNETMSELTDSFYSQMGPNGVSRKFWNVPEELLYEERGVIIGNVFVLAQVAIAQALSIFSKLRVFCSDQNVLPKKKEFYIKV